MGEISNLLTSAASASSAKKIQDAKDKGRQAVKDKAVAVEETKAAYKERDAAYQQKKAESILKSIPK